MLVAAQESRVPVPLPPGSTGAMLGAPWGGAQLMGGQ